MAIPEQVRRQTEAVAEHFRQQDSQASAEAEPAAPAPEPEQADSAANTAPEAAAPEQGTPTTPPEDVSEQRYRTLQGIYNADKARWQAESQVLSSRVGQLEQLISTLSAAPQAASPAPAEKLVTADDERDYGDSIDLMRRVSREEVSTALRRLDGIEQQLRQLQTNVAASVAQVTHSQATVQERAFWSGLSQAVPKWREINNDPRFHQWLYEVDPMTGNNRQAYLEDAQRRFDLDRVAAIFQGWIGANGQPAAQGTPNASGSQLEKQVAPGRSRSSGAPATPRPRKTYTTADITRFYADVRQGVYRGRDSERAEIERDIFAAQQDGRITATR